MNFRITDVRAEVLRLYTQLYFILRVISFPYNMLYLLFKFKIFPSLIFNYNSTILYKKKKKCYSSHILVLVENNIRNTILFVRRVVYVYNNIRFMQRNFIISQ